MYRNKAILAGARGWLSLHFGCTGLTQPNTYKLPLRDTVDSDWEKWYLINILSISTAKAKATGRGTSLR